MSSSGIAAGAGVGKAVSEWIAGGGPPSDLWCVDVSRFSRHHNQARFLEARIVEAVGNTYVLHYPGFEMSHGRGVRTSPLHSRLEKAGARWGEVMAWERPNWFAQSENGKCSQSRDNCMCVYDLAIIINSPCTLATNPGIICN